MPPDPGRTSPALGRRWWALLAAALFLAAVGQAARLSMEWQRNPLARAPILDAKTYWDWAADVAAGRFVQPVPYMSPPLYPYLLGAVRAAGGQLPAVYGLQVLAYLATAGLLAITAARRFSPTVGLLAAILFVLLGEPAYFTGRVLNATMQLLALAGLWWLLIRAQQRPAHARWLAAGVLTGLNCLLNPPMLLAIPLLAVWAWWEADGLRTGLLRAAVFVLAAAAAIAPATAHNYIATRRTGRGEFIPVSAQAGVTFAQGNAPGSRGTYTPVAGISSTHELQNIDARRAYQQATGRPGTWNEVNRYFFGQGLAYWAADPVRAAGLLAAKLYWFLSGRNAGDIYFPGLEAEQGLAPLSWLNPLPTTLLTLPALIGMARLARRPRHYAPELVLFLVPLLVVVLFYFSPRYRLPAVPMLVPAAAVALVELAHWRVRRGRACAVGAALMAGILLLPLNAALGFDRRGPYRGHFHHGLAEALAKLGRPESAAEEYRNALRHTPLPTTAANLGNLLNQLGRPAEALPYLQQAADAAPEDGIIRDQLARALLAQGRVAEALAQFREAVRLRPDRPDLRNNLANTLLRVDDFAGALEQYQTALRLDPGHANARLNLARVLRFRGDEEGALRTLAEGLRAGPGAPELHAELGRLRLQRGDVAGGLAALRRAHQLAPADATTANDLSWHLATAPGLGPAERAEALRIAQKLLADPTAPGPELLDTAAAALAANGRFTEAAALLERALGQTRDAAAAERFRQRLELYRSGRPYVAPAGPAAP